MYPHFALAVNGQYRRTLDRKPWFYQGFWLMGGYYRTLSHGNMVPVAVNISALQFQEPDFPGHVQSALTETGMPASMLELEITEEAAATDPERVISIMHELKSIGVSLAIDDFGTGYSSLSHLRRFPVDVLKIDQSFVREIDTSSTDASIVKLIVDLARELNFKIVVEGVETDKQYQQLKNWGCDLMQGFLFSKPIPAPEFAEILKQNHSSTEHGTISAERSHTLQFTSAR